MNNLVNSLSKYTGLSVDELTEAFEAAQESHKEDIEKLFFDSVSIDTNGRPADWTVDPGNFVDALFDYYTVELR